MRSLRINSKASRPNCSSSATCSPANYLPHPTPEVTMSEHKKCDHMNADGTFKEVDGSKFNGCILHMMECEGHDKESATKICGKIAQEKLAGAASPKSVALTGLSSSIQPRVSSPDLWIVYLPKGDCIVDQ